MRPLVKGPAALSRQDGGVESLSFRSNFFSNGAAVEFRLAHQDDTVLFAAVDDLKERYAELTGLYDIQDTFNLGKRQFDIELTPAGEAAGLLPADVARQLRNSFFGQEVQRIQRGRNELKVMVRYPESQRQSTQDLERIRIRLQDGTQTPLSTVARLKESRSFSSIERVDGLRIVSVTSEVDNSLTTPTQPKIMVSIAYIHWILKNNRPTGTGGGGRSAVAAVKRSGGRHSRCERGCGCGRDVVALGSGLARAEGERHDAIAGLSSCELAGMHRLQVEPQKDVAIAGVAIRTGLALIIFNISVLVAHAPRVSFVGPS